MPTIDDIAIANPCSAMWEEMSGDARARHCRLCSKTVYDTMGLTVCELTAMLDRPGPAPCLRVHRGTDGRILTRDRLARLGMAVAAAGLAACSGSGDSGWDSGASANTYVPRDAQTQTIPEVAATTAPTIPEVTTTAPITPPRIGEIAATPVVPDPPLVGRIAPRVPMGTPVPIEVGKIEMGDMAMPNVAMGGVSRPTTAR